MQKRFTNILSDMRRQITKWSASSSKGVLLAVSGGIDSMCMAELFAGLDDVTFAVAHCNFHLRGHESDEDEAMVRAWAREHKVELYVRDFDTVTYAKENEISIEMAARDLRYSWFAELCREHGYAALAVAHNANDNAETLILNMLRGTGLEGLKGMAAIAPIPAAEPSEAVLVRPLLSFTRKQIEGYMFAHKYPYRDDSTNASSEYKRNRIRNEVFPVFESVNPSFVKTLNREMSYFEEAGEIVRTYCETCVPDIVSQRVDGGISVDIHKLMSSRHWKYLLYHILEPYKFNSSTLASVQDLLTSERTVSGKTFYSAGHILQMERDRMDIRQLSHCKFPERGLVSGDCIMPVRAAGTYHFNGRSIKVELIEWTADMPLKQPADVLIMDADKLRFPFVLRSWRSGDWLIPFGMRGKKKVSDLFTDLKYGSAQKQTAIVLVDVQTPELAENQHIAAVAGVRIDDRYKITVSTSEAIRLTLC